MAYDGETLYAWTDIETTGGSIENGSCRPIEIAVVMTDDGLNVLDTYHTYVELPKDFDMNVVPEVVFEMHKKSGLWDDYHRAFNEYSTLTTQQVDTDLLDWTDQVYRWYSDKHEINMNWQPVLAGSGVSHYDSQLLRKYFPGWFRSLNGYDPEVKPTVDLGCMRRLFELFRLDLKPPGLDGGPFDSKDLPHRALDDVNLFIAQARWYRSVLNEIKDFYENPDKGRTLAVPLSGKSQDPWA